MNKYDAVDSCNKCGGRNKVVEVDSMWHAGMQVMSEAETECGDCGFMDYWAHGCFQSHLDGYDSCEKYQGGSNE